MRNHTVSEEHVDSCICELNCPCNLDKPLHSVRCKMCGIVYVLVEAGDVVLGGWLLHLNHVHYFSVNYLKMKALYF
ncbi:hypothetical protein D3C74_82200 [compost metagenome]